MIEAAGYEMHIRCDSGKHIERSPLSRQWAYSGISLRDCKKQAKDAGWKFLLNGKTLCPACNSK